MINLLPTESRTSLRMARYNVLLVRYLVGLACVVVFMGAIFGAGYLYTDNERKMIENEVAARRADIDKNSETIKSAKAFSDNLTLAKSILADQLVYSDMIVKITNVLSKGIILEDLSLDGSSAGSVFSLNAKAKTREDALIFKDALNKSDYFADASINSIDDSGVGTDAYRFKVRISVKLEAAVVTTKTTGSGN
jgi:hypothetical protein